MVNAIGKPVARLAVLIRKERTSARGWIPRGALLKMTVNVSGCRAPPPVDLGIAKAAIERTKLVERTQPCTAACLVGWIWAISLSPCAAAAQDPLEPIAVEGQPLAANGRRLAEAMAFLGRSFDADTLDALSAAARKRDAIALQRVLDPHVLFVVTINPEARVKVNRGPGPAVLQQAGFTPVLIKVRNFSTVTQSLRFVSPQAGPVYAGVAELSMRRQDQIHLRVNENVQRDRDRFLHLEMFTASPMTDRLSGLEVEYAIGLIYSSETGKREATIGFDIGQGNQDLGFRGETPVLFDVQPAVPVRLSVRDDDGSPTTARLIFRDASGRVFPPQAKRLAPDFFFQEQIYRRDGESVLLPPGKLTMQSSRGPEYRVLEREVTVAVPATGAAERAPIEVPLERWINPRAFGFYSGDHHIHAAGCAHYTSPTEGVRPEDMFLQVQGEGLNVGCVLTWGPCFEFQRQFFEPNTSEVSEPLTIVKYDLEISGFGSQALGHVCLLNLKDQVYPGSDGTKTKGWPTWTTPVLRWAKEQGAVTGYAHSASGLEVNAGAAAKRLAAAIDAKQDYLLPEPFETIDADRDRMLSESELRQSLDRAADRLPNLAIPEMNGVGAMEIGVTTALGLCDFISAMDTPRIAEWNMWYHIMNCGFPLKVSGETDFPCMSSTRVGQGRVYVQLGRVERLDFTAWCDGLRRGRSYVSDGYAHALEFTVAGQSPGFDDVHLEEPGGVQVKAQVAFAAEQPDAVAHGSAPPSLARRWLGDTVNLHGPRSRHVTQGGRRLVELVVNGVAVASREVPADGKLHAVEFSVPIERSSWVALRHFPQLHTNPVNVLVGNMPIRASRQSAIWCKQTIEQLWQSRGKTITASERDAAEGTFRKAIAIYEERAAEAPEGS